MRKIKFQNMYITTIQEKWLGVFHTQNMLICENYEGDKCPLPPSGFLTVLRIALGLIVNIYIFCFKFCKLFFSDEAYIFDWKDWNYKPMGFCLYFTITNSTVSFISDLNARLWLMNIKLYLKKFPGFFSFCKEKLIRLEILFFPINLMSVVGFQIKILNLVH